MMIIIKALFTQLSAWSQEIYEYSAHFKNKICLKTFLTRNGVVPRNAANISSKHLVVRVRRNDRDPSMIALLGAAGPLTQQKWWQQITRTNTQRVLCCWVQHSCNGSSCVTGTHTDSNISWGNSVLKKYPVPSWHIPDSFQIPSHSQFTFFKYQMMTGSILSSKTFRQ
jgi:hypothetical protein